MNDISRTINLRHKWMINERHFYIDKFIVLCRSFRKLNPYFTGVRGSWYSRNCDRLRLTKSVVLFGHDHIIKTDKGIDYILLQAKCFIYKCRFTKTINIPQIEHFLKDLKYIYKVDEYTHKLEMSQHNFTLKWSPYQGIVSD